MRDEKDKLMNQATDKFFNMYVNLVKNGKIYGENAAIRNIWEKDKTFFFDVYLYRLKKSFIFESSYIHNLFDVSREKGYNDAASFVKDFFAAVGQGTPKQPPLQTSKDNLLDALRADLTILQFMSRLDKGSQVLKNKIIFDYIKKSVPEAKSFSDLYLLKILSDIRPEPVDFYRAVTSLKRKTPIEAECFLKEIVKVCQTDGFLNYTERMYLADVAQFLRQEGLKLPEKLL